MDVLRTRIKNVIKDDDVNLYVKKMIEADAIILGSPVYFPICLRN